MNNITRYSVLFLCQFFFFTTAFAQEYEGEELPQADHSQTDWYLEMLAEQPNILQAEKAYSDYFNLYPKEESKLRNIFRRWIEDARLSMDADGNHLPNPLPPHKYMLPNLEKSTGSWEIIGPNFAEKTKCNTSSDLSGGFCDRVYINPYNTNNLLAGFSYGGLWVSQDQGDTWSLTDANIPNGTNTYANRDLYYGEIEASAVSPSLVYAATEYGLLKSANSGADWSICPDLNREDAGDIRSYYIALSKADSNVVLSTFGRQLFRSADGGDTWAVVFDNSNGGPNHYSTSQYSNNSTFGIYERTYNFFGLEGSETDANVFYLGIFNANNEPEIYKSTDAGLTFDLLVDLNNNLGRSLPPNLVLKTIQSQPEKFFVHSLFVYDSLYQFQQNGDLLDRKLINTSVTTFGTNVNILEAFAIDQLDENNVYGGFYFASAITKSTDGGNTFVDKTSGYAGCPKYVHPDVRSLDAVGGIVLIGSDGGLAISKNGMTTVTSDIAREISSVDLWGFSSSPRTDLLVVGCDHGPTKVRRFNGDNGWISLGGGDASDCSINTSNESYIVFDRAIDYQFGAELDEDNDVISESNIADNFDLNQVAFHPHLYPNAYTKDDNMLLKMTDNFLFSEVVNTFGSNIRVNRIAPDNPETLYVLLSNNKIQKSTDAGATWNEVTPPSTVSMGQNNITDIVVGKDENEIWASYGNWQNEAKILKSIDGGATWTNITTTNLPVTPVSQIAYQAGTDGGIYLAFAGISGVWYRNNSMGMWEQLGSGLPSMGYIRNIFTVPNQGKLRIGSSRGAYEHDLYEASLPVANFAFFANEVFCGIGLQYQQNSIHAPGAVTYDWSFPGGMPSSSTEAAPYVEYFQAGEFTVSLTITDAAGNSSTKTLTNYISVEDGPDCIDVGVLETPFENLSVYPIPAQKTIYVELPQAEKELRCELVNSLGQVVRKNVFYQQAAVSIDVSDLPVGNYFLRVIGAENYSNIKVVRD